MQERVVECRADSQSSFLICHTYIPKSSKQFKSLYEMNFGHEPFDEDNVLLLQQRIFESSFLLDKICTKIHTKYENHVDKKSISCLMDRSSMIGYWLIAHDVMYLNGESWCNVIDIPIDQPMWDFNKTIYRTAIYKGTIRSWLTTCSDIDLIQKLIE